MIGQTANHFQQAPFPVAEEGDSGFNQMTGAVKFMTLRQIAPAFFGRFTVKVSIEIAIFALGGGDQFNYLVGGFPVRRPASGTATGLPLPAILATSLS